jgi:hypothetical protein
MPQPQPNPFATGKRLVANPYLYDYVHTLEFHSAGIIEMVDGAGQRLNTLVHGRFSVEQVSPTAFLVSLTDLVEINPYYTLERFRGLDLAAYAKAVQGYVPYEEHDVRRRLDPFSVHVAQEEGLFSLRQHVIWKIRDAQEWPYLLYRVRYRFASDPLAPFLPNRQGNLYYQEETPEPDTRVYYRVEDAQRLTARELAQRGIAVEDELS